MNDFEEPSGDVKKLIDQFLDDTISDDSMRQLDECLNASSQLRTFFLNYCQMHIELGTDAAVEQRAEKAFGMFCRRREYIATAAAPTANTAAPPRALSRVRGWSAAAAAVLAVAATLLIAGWSVDLLPKERITEEQIASQGSTENGPTGNANRLPVVTALNVGKSSTTLRLEGIGYVTVDGPTDFCLVGPMRARLNYGRVKMRVTEKTGHGFVIETPDGEVTDLGTEFALNVTQGSDTSLIVREGMVDLRAGALAQANKPERLVAGDGVTFNKMGEFDRIMSIISTDEISFQSAAAGHSGEKLSLIQSVTDSLHSSDTKKFYEIVPGGLREDARAYVDRDYEWNGCDASGMPEFLLGAEYVKTFNDYKRRAFKIELEFSRPANLYVFWDEVSPLADWLLKDFTNTGLFIGVDEGPEKHNHFTPGELEIGPGKSINKRYSIWHRPVSEAGRVELGAITHEKLKMISMYGIAVTEMESSN